MSLGSVAALMILFLYVFSIMAVYLFAGIKLQDNLSSYANFQHF